MKKIAIVLIAFLAFGLSQMQGQKNYNSAIGLRLGLPYGITGKTFISEQDALEGILHFRDNYVGFTGLYERHVMLANVPELNFFYGAGAGIAIFNSRYSGNNNFSIGIDAIIGVEYTIPNAPINLSLDLKPYINVVPQFGQNDDWVQAAISARYTF